MNKVIAYLINTRYGRMYWALYIPVVLIYFKGFTFLLSNLEFVLSIIVYIFLFTYSGLYMINSYKDYEKDKAEKYSFNTTWKRSTYLYFGLIHIFVGLVLTQTFLKEYQVYNFVFIFLNIAYTFYFKSKFGFLSLLFISPTHIIRIILAMQIVDIKFIYYLPFLFNFYFITVIGHLLKHRAKKRIEEDKFNIIIGVLVSVSVSISLFEIMNKESLGVLTLLLVILLTNSMKNRNLSEKIAKGNL